MRELEIKTLTAEETYQGAIFIEMTSRNEGLDKMRHPNVGNMGGDNRQNTLKGEGALLALREL